jgi:nitrogen fixation protein NifU and related proteins
MDLKALYHEIIVDHNRRPRNFRRIENATRTAEGYNPLCGDKLKLYVVIDDGIIADVAFEGSGCAISMASASLLTERLKGRSADEAEALFGNMHELLTGRDEEADLEKLGKLAALAGVRAYPSRVKCATLSWHTLHAALHAQEQATTE